MGIDRAAVELAIAEALAERYTESTGPNPMWSRNAERSAWHDGVEYDVPEFVSCPMETRVKRTVMEHGTAGDGLPSMWVPRIEQVAEVAAEAVARLLDGGA